LNATPPDTDNVPGCHDVDGRVTFNQQQVGAFSRGDDPSIGDLESIGNVCGGSLECIDWAETGADQ